MRVRLLVAYNGAPFYGFAENLGVRSVAGDLRAALEQIVGHAVVLTCAGRTDKGVHAWGQVISTDLEVDPARLGRLQISLNQMCGPDIAVRALDVAGDDFDARHSATGRRYWYDIATGLVASPFTASTHWHIRGSLDLEQMRTGAAHLIGTNHFGSFCKKNSSKPNATMYRNLRRVDLQTGFDELSNPTLRVELEASAFCHQMVRSIVGLLVDVGLGKRLAADVPLVLAARDRNAAPPIAPPHGLTLVEVTYE
ncbi:MAG: tRNA pseudouridine(38-40) synthase TruA [Acidobacteria bacterium]|nr:tRNA pseudouridine(38-40) synthase TruA [Acidobacteriota bacterium]